MKIYFASPFFTPIQIEREERLKSKLRSFGYNVFSPKEAYVCKPNEPIEKRKEVFKGNIDNIIDADAIFVVTDEKDLGTIWEAGFANGLNAARNNKIIIIYYCETLAEGKTFNLMLAQSGDIIITKFEDMEKLPKLIETGEKLEYAGAIQ